MKRPFLRRDGFAGQHLVVVPAPIQNTARNDPLLKGLFVTDAGYFPDAKGHFVERPNGAPTHLVLACLRGSGWAKSGTNEYSIHAGDLVWLHAKRSHAYGANRDEPWTIGWVHFTGDEAEHWRKFVGFPDTPIAVLSHVSAEGISALKFEQIYLHLEHGYSIPELVSTAITLRHALSLAAHAVRIGGTARSSKERIAAVRDHLKETLDQQHSLHELASAAGLSVPHFCALFRQQTGYAPIDFLIRQRMRHACRLLDTTDNSIAAVAAEVGYEDAYYFTRSFRRIVGCPPRTYRKTTKG
ncbi:MAG: AraC family transcriptional regulator [Opitutaceae bacterium]